ncbi:hypothetical protein K469DRAFT_777609 [Zopfia rhizophila CBS 207.26]|uniref:Cytochrome P450 n=1 Tax=Zopfia rhizophila CBS 207.26 TaxID=1314779 RepID=A0A6A6E6E3_9PEZI|nr:hypothetical protein K469DRAFT_777609 [Zopfia rhizophila CBS 207.26]
MSLIGTRPGAYRIFSEDPESTWPPCTIPRTGWTATIFGDYGPKPHQKGLFGLEAGDTKAFHNQIFETAVGTPKEALKLYAADESLQITRSTIETLFRSVILEEYPEIVKDFWKFDSNLQNYTRGLPRFMMASAYAARDQLLKNLKEWIRKCQDADSPKIGEGDPAWDATAGSKFFRH